MGGSSGSGEASEEDETLGRRKSVRQRGYGDSVSRDGPDSDSYLRSHITYVSDHTMMHFAVLTISVFGRLWHTRFIHIFTRSATNYN